MLQVFDQVDLEIDACNAKLTQTPSVNVLNEVQSALDVLHPRVAQVTRKAPSIDVRKRQICEHLISLECSHRGVEIPSKSKGTYFLQFW